MGIIILPPGGIEKLAADFKYSRQTVSAALRGKYDSSVAKMLRAAALERGGTEYHPEERDTSADYTRFDSGSKTMTQTFGQNVKLVADLPAGSVKLYVNGALQQTYTDVTLQRLSVIQDEAEHTAALSNG